MQSTWKEYPFHIRNIGNNPIKHSHVNTSNNRNMLIFRFLKTRLLPLGYPFPIGIFRSKGIWTWLLRMGSMSVLPQPYIPSALCSLSPMFPQPYVPQPYVPSGQKGPHIPSALCSLSPMFPQPYVPSACQLAPSVALCTHVHDTMGIFSMISIYGRNCQRCRPYWCYVIQYAFLAL